MARFKPVKIIYDILETGLVAIGISAILYLTVLIPNQIDGDSMQPNFFHNELILTNKVVQWLGPTVIGEKINYNYERGDVVIFEANSNILIKRIIAKGGDTLMLRDDHIYINGKQLDEKYIPPSTRTNFMPGLENLFNEEEVVTVPEDHYFLLGDNREHSKDSRVAQIGFIPRESINGRVFLRYWPFSEFGLVKAGEFDELDILDNVEQSNPNTL